MNAQATNFEHQERFDTDSRPCGIDNRASACMSDSVADFQGPLIDSTRYIRGFGGTKTYNIKKGTLVWSIEDDLGKVTKFHIKNSYYVPDGKVKLPSPQHWIQNIGPLLRKDASSVTLKDKITISWNAGQSV